MCAPGDLHAWAVDEAKGSFEEDTNRHVLYLHGMDLYRSKLLHRWAILMPLSLWDAVVQEIAAGLCLTLSLSMFNTCNFLAGMFSARHPICSALRMMFPMTWHGYGLLRIVRKSAKLFYVILDNDFSWWRGLGRGDGLAELLRVRRVEVSYSHIKMRWRISASSHTSHLYTLLVSAVVRCKTIRSHFELTTSIIIMMRLAVCTCLGWASVRNAITRKLLHQMTDKWQQEAKTCMWECSDWAILESQMATHSHIFIVEMASSAQIRVYYCSCAADILLHGNSLL